MLVRLSAIVLAVGGLVLAQTAPQFEVASVKINTINGPPGVVPQRSGDLVTMHNTQPYSVIAYAFHIKANYQIAGYTRLPDGWNWYDIDARTGGDVSEDQLRLMFRSLLEDRFKLKAHHETRELPEYELVPASSKPKLTPSRDGPMNVTIEEKTFTQRPGTCGVSLWREGNHLTCHAATVEQVAERLTGILEAPVLDRTGLTGTYDLNVRFIPNGHVPEIDAASAPTLEQAIREELGLRLEKTRGPVDVLVIDHLEKPSEN